MQLGTDKANSNIKFLISEGFTKPQATIITKSNDHKEKEILKCLFKHKNIFPNYIQGEGHRGRYMLNYDFVINLLERENIKYYVGNIAPRGGQTGKFISLNKKVYQKVLKKDPEFVES